MKAREGQPRRPAKVLWGAGPFPYDPARVKVIAGATVIEEMSPLMPPEMARSTAELTSPSPLSVIPAAPDQP
jgi:hypothetical protein